MSIIGYWNSLAEVQKLVADVLVQGIIEEVIEEGQLIPRLPVTGLSGESLVYNRESNLPTADFYDIGDDIQEGDAIAFTQVTATLKRLIGQWDLDKFNIKTYSNPNNLRAMAVSQSRKGVMRTAEDSIIYGDSTAGKGFSGLQKTAATAMRIFQGATSTTGGALSLANLDSLIHSVKPKPDLLVMNWNIWNRLSAIGRIAAGSYGAVIERAREGENIAQGVTAYRDVPIVVSDYIGQVESVAASTYSAKTGGNCTSIFAIRLGSVEEGGLTLVTGNPMFEIGNFDALEKKDAERFRLVWYLTMALGSTKSLGVIDGITNVAVVV